MRAYQECFDRHGTHTAQILLTAGDFDSRARYLNARNTILSLFEWDVLPIINENDTVSVAEIRFGDNDHLAAMVTNLLRAPLLILLTVVDGLFAGDPGTDPSATKLDTVPAIDAQILGMAGAGKSVLGTGGMQSKLRAARHGDAAGESVIMANGSTPGILDAIFAGEPVGHAVSAARDLAPVMETLAGLHGPPKGRLIVDAGAHAAVRDKGRSLLPIGLVEVHGEFSKGAVVTLCDPTGAEFARGLTNYSSVDARRVLGLRTEQITELFGTLAYEEIVHRDNLVLIA